MHDIPGWRGWLLRPHCIGDDRVEKVRICHMCTCFINVGELCIGMWWQKKLIVLMLICFFLQVENVSLCVGALRALGADVGAVNPGELSAGTTLRPVLALLFALSRHKQRAKQLQDMPRWVISILLLYQRPRLFYLAKVITTIVIWTRIFFFCIVINWLICYLCKYSYRTIWEVICSYLLYRLVR